MKYTIKAPQNIDTIINLPASKSISNRALIINALTGSGIFPQNLSDCDDTDVIVRALTLRPDIIDIMAAGTAMRFMTAYLSISEGEEHLLTGSDRMKHRPIKELVEALRSLGADIEYEVEEGFPPLRIKGRRLHGGQLDVPGNVSSQFISALLLIAPMLDEGLELRLLGEIISRPYIDLTLHVMHEFGAIAEWTDVNTIAVEAQPYCKRDYTIENDWTSAGYWYAILSLIADPNSRIVLPGLMNASRQGDSASKYIFSLLGVKTAFESKQSGVLTNLTLTKHQRPLPRFEYDFINQPDLVQTLIALCPVMNTHFLFTGLSSLRIKETDRIEAMRREMAKLGYVLHIIGDDILWNGERCTPDVTPIIDTYDDHRMAMSFAPLSICLGEITIKNPEVVSKSYPNFWADLRTAGFIVE